jgi:hypothetical protein
LGAAVRGGLKKAAEKYIGEEFSEQVADMVSLPETKTKDDGDDHIGEVGSQAIADGMAELANSNEVYALGPKATLDELRLHRQARRALTDLKNALATIVSNIRRDSERGAPIFIFVDELDRCSPTYAVSMLEEIKHIFDVPGVIFVLGMQPAQLAMSIKGVYGTDFDGATYLERLISYRFNLARPSLDDFVAWRLKQEPFPYHKFIKDYWERPLENCIATVVNNAGLKPRAVDRVLERMRTAAFACETEGILDPTYLAVRCLSTETTGQPLTSAKQITGTYNYRNHDFQIVRVELQTSDFNIINDLPTLCTVSGSLADYLKQYNSGAAGAALMVTAMRAAMANSNDPIKPFYDELLSKVAAFTERSGHEESDTMLAAATT